MGWTASSADVSCSSGMCPIKDGGDCFGCRVSQHSKSTLMTADNLSICFWPTLMRPDFENKDTLSTTKLNQAVVESFILQSDYFFYGGEVAESSSSEGTPPPHCHSMVEALLPLQLPPPLQPQQIQHAVHPDPLI